MKGQIVVDVLMLGLVLVVVIGTMHVFLGEQTLRSQSLRYQATQHQAAMISVLEKQVELKGVRGRISDVLAFHACNGCPTETELNYCPGLEEEINSTLFRMNEGQRHYIFASSGIIAYDDRKTVCLDAIPVARQTIPTKCGKIEIIYGSWLKSFEPPEVC